MSRRANNLDGKEWLKNSISIWRDITRTADERKLDHPAIFPIKLAQRIIDTFVNINSEGEKPTIFDPFFGSGTTLVAAALKGLNGVGFELSEAYSQLASERLRDLPNWEETERTTGKAVFQEKKGSIINLFRGDARQLGLSLDQESINLTLTSPPYWNVLKRRRTADKRANRTYKQLEEGMSLDLSRFENYDSFLATQASIFASVFRATKLEGYLIVVVMDVRQGKNFFPLHIDYSLLLQQLGFTLDDIIIWDRSGEYNNLRPLGYPYVFRVNKVHEYLLIFQKRGRTND